MGKKVFANGREVSAKADDNKSIAGFPDVCLSPPSPPAGPLPIPYPNFSNASDTDSGTNDVKIGGKKIGQKKKSNYKSSKGDEAATKTLGMGTVIHGIQGKTYHAAWSSDVKFEGENAIRQLDLTTHNHMCDPMNSGALTVDVAAMIAAGAAGEDICKALDEKNEAERQVFEADDRVTYQKIGGESTTITHGTYTSPTGITGEVKACSRAIRSSYDNGFLPGLGSDDSGSYVDCENSPHHYTQRANMKYTCHTESRIIETIFQHGGSNPGGKLLLSINWHNKKNRDVADWACSECENLICAAQGCGLKIELCQGDPSSPTEPDCD